MTVSFISVAEAARRGPRLFEGQPAQFVPRPTVDDNYREGMANYLQMDYAMALKYFDHAVSMGDQRLKTMDGRAAAMSRLGGELRGKAAQVATNMCKKYGSQSYQPWYRLGSILIALRMPREAEKSINKGLALNLASDSAGRESLLRLQRHIEGLLAAEPAPEPEAASYANTHVLPRDVLILIAEAALENDPHVASRMALVCRTWRSAMLSWRAGWNQLVLGERDPLAKAQLWAERSNNRITSLTFPYRFKMPPWLQEEIATALLPIVGGVQDLTLAPFDAGQYKVWKGHLRVKSLRSYQRRLEHITGDVMLLAPEEGLEVIDYGDMLDRPCNDFMRTEHGFMPFDPEFSRRVAKLKVLRVSYGMICNTQWLRTLSEAAPLLEELSVACRTRGYDPDDTESSIFFDHLTRLEVCDDAGMAAGLFRAVSAPALTHFSCWGGGSMWWRMIDNMPGLPLSNLVSLDIGENPVIDLGRYLDALSTCTNLQFLNASFCNLDNDFLEAMVVKTGDTPPLLPKLTALSIAGHERMTAGPLRRMVVSRMSFPRRRAAEAPAPAPPAKRSAFAPSRGRIQPANPRAEATPTPAPEPVRPDVAQLQWLNVDMCTNPLMDVDVLASLRKNMRFLSNANTRNFDRIRGRKRFAWDAGVPGVSSSSVL